MQARDARVSAALEGAGTVVRSFPGVLMREPGEVRVDMGGGRWVGHFGTLSPFMRRAGPGQARVHGHLHPWCARGAPVWCCCAAFSQLAPPARHSHCSVCCHERIGADQFISTLACL